MLQNVDTVAAGQDEPQETTTTLKAPTIIRRGKQTTRYKQEELVSIATRRASIREAMQELARLDRQLEREENAILDLVNARGSITMHPSPEQRRFIRMFEKAMIGTDPEFLKLTFDLCEECGAHRTNWIDQERQPMMVAFTRRLSEMGDGGKGSGK